MKQSAVIHLRLQAHERHECEEQALSRNLSLSDYLRLALGYKPVGKRDKRSR